MTVSHVSPRRLSADDKREHVLAYQATPYGFKRDYLADHRISHKRMMKWKSALADGDLDHDLYPRHAGNMTRDEVAEIRRLRLQVAALEEDRARAETELESYRRATDALGKAIDAMHSRGVASAEDESG